RFTGRSCDQQLRLDGGAAVGGRNPGEVAGANPDQQLAGGGQGQVHDDWDSVGLSV
ncbi:unnamed protein product, partial [Didymodactylos carnosus]